MSTDLFVNINTETSKTKIFVFHVITVRNYNRLSRINIRSFYNCSSKLPVMTDDWSLGYLLKVDLKYSDKLHELHNDYPLAPEKLAFSSDMLSKYCKEIANKYEIKVGDVK